MDNTPTPALPWKQYKRKGLSEMRPYVIGEDMTNISVSDQDKLLPTLEGGYVARNPVNHADQWYVAKKYFDDNLEEFYGQKIDLDKKFENIIDRDYKGEQNKAHEL